MLQAKFPVVVCWTSSKPISDHFGVQSELMDYRRFECIFHLVTAAHYGTLQEALRAVELSKDELLTILHRIEWDASTRIFSIEDDRLVLTSAGAEHVRMWEEALRTLGIVR